MRQNHFHENLSSLYVVVDQLSNEFKTVRLEALSFLEEIAQCESCIFPVNAVIGRLVDRDDDVRSKAAKILEDLADQFPDKFVNIPPKFIRALKNKSHSQDCCNYILHEWPERFPLENIVSKISNWRIKTRELAINLIGKLSETIPEKISVDVLLERLADRSWKVRAKTVDVLSKMALIAPEQFRGAPEGFVTAIQTKIHGPDGYEYLISHWPEIFPVKNLMEQLVDREREDRESAAIVLGRLAAANPEQIPLEALIDRLADSSWIVRNAAVNVLGEIASVFPDKFKHAPTAFTDSLKEKKYGGEGYEYLVSWPARFSVARLKERLENGDLETIPEIIHFLSWMVKGELQYRNWASFPCDLIVEFLEADDWNIRKASVNFLCTIGRFAPHRYPLEGVLEKIKDQDYWVRRDALKSLETLAEEAPERILPVLIELLEKEDHDEVRKELVSIIKKTMDTFARNDGILPKFLDSLKKVKLNGQLPRPEAGGTHNKGEIKNLR